MLNVSMRQSKLGGCMVGSLMGDVLGAPFEGEIVVHNSNLNKYFTNLKDPRCSDMIQNYTDDTAMTRQVAQSLIVCKKYDAVDMARRFVTEYYSEPYRGYGANIAKVFSALRSQRFQDVYKPAGEQFGGSGSYGNGGAMRVAPVALFHKNMSDAIEVAKNSALLTHGNPAGYNGAVLQCIAVHQALQLDPTETLNSTHYIDELISNMKTVEDAENKQSYHTALMKMRELLDEDAEDRKVVKVLGHDIAAYRSVPTAVYCFLKQNKVNPEAGGVLERSLQYAISLGGDTDTIGSMCGAIAGAYYGEQGISEELQNQCEGVHNARAQAQLIYELTMDT